MLGVFKGGSVMGILLKLLAGLGRAGGSKRCCRRRWARTICSMGPWRRRRGRGLTASLGGVFGLTLGLDEGVELNLLGLGLGIDLRRPALKLPGVERIGMAPFMKGQGNE
ncbi:MAG: hypothetical protein R6U30_11265 [Halomonas sp.]|uniref:hypothetical protein n=1 Tax=Halomonas sp. TaxID=1486246 RepID=UPI003970684C